MIENKYLKIDEKKRCSGCTACVAVCPKRCITMQEDEEGFLYPIVDITTCIQCSKCIKVCPYTDSEFTNKPKEEELSICYAAYNKNEEIRYKSASGGMFRVFADQIIAEGGVVFGAAFARDFTVEHTYTETFEGLTAFMGSKYLQSRMGDSFTLVKQFLKEGRKVLFTGCGCQIAGLKRYLKKDDTNLICIDLICHGVGSPKIWIDYLNNYFTDNNILSINCRDKIKGWSSSSYTIEGKKKIYSEVVHNNIYHKNYIKNLFIRPACAICPFRGNNRVSDITLADCWGFQQIAPEMNDEKGLSSVILHTSKGKTLFDFTTSEFVFKSILESDIQQYNPDYVRSMPFNYNRRTAFWKDYSRMPFKELFEKYSKESKKQKILCFIKKILKKVFAFVKRNVRLILNIRTTQFKKVKSIIEIDKRFNETFRFGGKKMPASFRRQPEWRFIVAYRKFQANRDNILGIYYRHKLNSIEHRTGIHIENNPNFGKGIIIGHYGRIIINGNTKFGDQIYITHGVTIGQNATGKRKGAPVIGNRVRIGANATIVGNVRIGSDVMIAPNSFVNIDVPDHSVVVGNPCVIHYKENATKGYLGEIN